MNMKISVIVSTLLFAFHTFAYAQKNEALGKPSGEDAAKVVAAGTLPDEASRAAIMGKLRDLYGAANVVDHLEVGGVVPPPNWTEHMTKALNANLKQVHKGQLKVSGTQIAIRGNVANEVLRQKLVGDLATTLNPTYTINNGLVVVGVEAQDVLDKTLSNRVVEFESGAATLTPIGRLVVDEMGAAIKQIGMPKLQLIGHTDSVGNRQANVALSLARANSVRSALIEKGIPGDSMNAMGSGPDQPIASNDSSEGRAKNRRIEFRLAN